MITKRLILIMLLSLVPFTQKSAAIDLRDCITIYGLPVNRELFKQYLERESQAVFKWREKKGRYLLCIDSYNPRRSRESLGEFSFAPAAAPNRDAVKMMRAVIRRLMVEMPGVRYEVGMHLPRTVFDNQTEKADAYSVAQIDIADLFATQSQDPDAARVLLFHILSERIYERTMDSKEAHERALRDEALFMSKLTGKDEGKQAMHCYNQETGELLITFKSTQFRLQLITGGIFGEQNSDIRSVERTTPNVEWADHQKKLTCPAGYY